MTNKICELDGYFEPLQLVVRHVSGGFRKVVYHRHTTNPLHAMGDMLLDTLEVKAGGGFGVVHELNRVQLHDANDSTNAYNQATLRRHINITPNDILAGNTYILLNFSGKPITAKIGNSAINTFAPLIMDERTKAAVAGGLDDCVILLEAMPINTKGPKQAISGAGEFWELLQSTAPDETALNQESKEFKESSLFLDRFFSSKEYHEIAGKSSNSATLIRSMVIRFNKKHSSCGSDILTYMDTRLGLWVSRLNESHLRGVIRASRINESAKGGSTIPMANAICCQINDKGSNYATRFTTVAGQIVEIPKVRDVHRREGLYLTQYDSEGVVTHHQNFELNDPNIASFVFADRESAMRGADVITMQEHQRRLELIQAERDKNSDNVATNRALNELRVEHERAQASLKAELNEKRLELERLQTESALREATHKQELEQASFELKQQAQQRDAEHARRLQEAERNALELKQQLQQQAQQRDAEHARLMQEADRNAMEFKQQLQQQAQQRDAEHARLMQEADRNAFELKQQLQQQAQQRDAQHSREMFELNAALERAKSDVERAKQDNERLKQEFAREREWLAAGAERRKDYYDSVSAHRKDHFDERRFARDDWMETLKIAGGVLGLAAAGYVAYSKLAGK